MSINYLPEKVVKKQLPKKKIERLLTQKLTVNKSALNFFDDLEFISKKDIKNSALKVTRQYKKKFKELRKEGISVKESTEETLAKKKLLLQRVENLAIFEISQSIKEKYKGEFYIWLPSSASDPRPEHQLKYGKRYQIGKGEIPGEAFGCKCGMNILVPEKRLEL